MFDPVIPFFAGALFFLLTPGVILSLPPKGSKLLVALTHAVVFALLFQLTQKAVYDQFHKTKENFANSMSGYGVAMDIFLMFVLGVIIGLSVYYSGGFALIPILSGMQR